MVHAAETPPIEVEELLLCRIQEWYDRFKSSTFKTILIELDDDVVEWLLADGVSASGGNQAFGRIADVSSPSDSSDSEKDTDVEPATDFPELRARIEAAIAALGGSVVPKLTWSCPKDAVWLTHDNTMRCTCADEVLLLLKSSDRVAHDISDAVPETAKAAGWNKECPQPKHTLALREWHEVHPDREFRCFVVDGTLKGISQRDVTHRYASLQNTATQLQFRDWIEAFFRRIVLRRAKLANFAADVVVGPAGRVMLVDINPAGGTTAPLLFTWEELLGSTRPAQADSGDQDQSTSAQVRDSDPPGQEERTPSSVPGGDPKPLATGGSDSVGASASLGYLEQLRQAQRQAMENVPARRRLRGAAQPAAQHPAECACCTIPAATSMLLCELRIVADEAPMQPNVAAYGVPYDFIDTSNGSALNQLLSQSDRAGNLWNSLAKQAQIS